MTHKKRKLDHIDQDDDSLASFKRVRILSKKPSDLFVGERGAVEFDKSMAYVNKVKVGTQGYKCFTEKLPSEAKSRKAYFRHQTEISHQCLQIWQKYMRDSKPVEDIYAEKAFLFHSAPELRKELIDFLPGSKKRAQHE